MTGLGKDLTILVPQGAEYQAVCRGLKRVKEPPIVLPIPAGAAPLTRYLKQHSWEARSPVLLMGLCGGLTPESAVAARVVYRECISASTGKVLACDRALTETLQQRLGGLQVRGVTSDRVIASAAEKQQLAQQHRAEVVDMEGMAALEFFSQLEIPVAMVRVVSDGCTHSIPDLSAAFDPDGKLQPLALAGSLLKEPIAAFHLIWGSLQGLSRLQKLTSELFARD